MTTTDDRVSRSVRDRQQVANIDNQRCSSNNQQVVAS